MFSPSSAASSLSSVGLPSASVTLSPKKSKTRPDGHGHGQGHGDGQGAYIADFSWNRVSRALYYLIQRSPRQGDTCWVEAGVAKEQGPAQVLRFYLRNLKVRRSAGDRASEAELARIDGLINQGKK